MSNLLQICFVFISNLLFFDRMWNKKAESLDSAFFVWNTSLLLYVFRSVYFVHPYATRLAPKAAASTSLSVCLAFFKATALRFCRFRTAFAAAVSYANGVQSARLARIVKPAGTDVALNPLFALFLSKHRCFPSFFIDALSMSRQPFFIAANCVFSSKFCFFHRQKGGN